MARPWIEFLYAQKIPWSQGLYGGARPDVSSKILSIDESAGDSSAIIRYPAGWVRNSPEVITVEEEFFILDGSIEINSQTYDRECYGNFPAGYVRESASSISGCVALTFFDGEPRLTEDRSESYSKDGLIEFINTLDINWDSATADPKLEWMGNRRKVLKWSREYNQKETFLFTTPPHIYPSNWACPILTHPCVEESFMLSGEITGPYGKMTKGAYFWRPQDKPHGPFGTRGGGLSLIRFKYGKHVNIWGQENVPYHFDFEYNPELPLDLAYLADTPYLGPERF